MKLTTCWINNQTRPEKFSRTSSFTCFGEEIRKSKTVVVKSDGKAVSTTIDFTLLKFYFCIFVFLCELKSLHE